MKRYYLICITESKGYTSNKVLYTIDWIDQQSLEHLQSVIDPTFQNFQRCGWHHIVTLKSPYGLYENLKRIRAKDNTWVIDADGPPFFVEELTLEEIQQRVKHQLDRLPAKQTIHNGLFEVK